MIIIQQRSSDGTKTIADEEGEFSVLERSFAFV